MVALEIKIGGRKRGGWVRKKFKKYYMYVLPWREGDDLVPSRTEFDIAVHVADSGEKVGFLWVIHEGSAICAAGVEVAEGHRRLGLATAMYSWAEELSGKTMVPASEAEEETYEELLSPDARAFWASRRG